MTLDYNRDRTRVDIRLKYRLNYHKTLDYHKDYTTRLIMMRSKPDYVEIVLL